MAIATPFSFWRGGSIGGKGWGAVAGAYKHSAPVGLHVVNDVGMASGTPTLAGTTIDIAIPVLNH